MTAVFSPFSRVSCTGYQKNASTTWHYVTPNEMTADLMRCDILRGLLWHQLSQAPTHDLYLGLKVHLGRHKQHANKCHVAMALSKQYGKLNTHANNQLGSMSCEKDGQWSGQDCLQGAVCRGLRASAVVGKWHLRAVTQDWRRTMKNGCMVLFCGSGWWCLTHTVFNTSAQHQSAINSVAFDQGLFVLPEPVSSKLRQVSRDLQNEIVFFVGLVFFFFFFDTFHKLATNTPHTTCVLLERERDCSRAIIYFRLTVYLKLKLKKKKKTYNPPLF